MAKVLIIEDEKSINDLILMNLSLVGHTCFQALNGKEAASVLNKCNPNLILLDVMIPFQDGFSLMKDRVFKNIPVIFLTAKTSVADKVKGLNLGADDYITKPFEAVELIARVDAVLRRTKQFVQSEFRIGKACVNTLERKARLNNIEVELTNREFELLEILIKNRNIALSREKLLDLVWGYDFTGDIRTVDVHITKLRKKLNLERYIKTVYKLGYRLEV
ncbi:MAG: response regulator transcription factor [Ruminococcus sp.]|nr:response regulator transcription factor [Ruminococcus sp.]